MRIQLVCASSRWTRWNWRPIGSWIKSPHTMPNRISALTNTWWNCSTKQHKKLPTAWIKVKSWTMRTTIKWTISCLSSMNHAIATTARLCAPYATWVIIYGMRISIVFDGNSYGLLASGQHWNKKVGVLGARQWSDAQKKFVESCERFAKWTDWFERYRANFGSRDLGSVIDEAFQWKRH